MRAFTILVFSSALMGCGGSAVPSTEASNSSGKADNLGTTGTTSNPVIGSWYGNDAGYIFGIVAFKADNTLSAYGFCPAGTYTGGCDYSHSIAGGYRMGGTAQKPTLSFWIGSEDHTTTWDVSLTSNGTALSLSSGAWVQPYTRLIQGNLDITDDSTSDPAANKAAYFCMTDADCGLQNIPSPNGETWRCQVVAGSEDDADQEGAYSECVAATN